MSFAIRRRDGSEVTLAEIRTAAEGEALLEELDQAIIAIEEQIERAKSRKTDRDWLIRTKTAARHRRIMRPKLQERIADLRRTERAAEKAAAIEVEKAENARRTDGRRRAFILAAKDTLEPCVFDQIWKRARVISPDAFDDEAA